MALPDGSPVGYTSGKGTSVVWEIRGAHRWAGEREREEEERHSCCGGLYFACIFYSVSSVCVRVCVCGLSRETSLIVMSCVRSVCVLCARGSTERSTIDVEREI